MNDQRATLPLPNNAAEPTWASIQTGFHAHRDYEIHAHYQGGAITVNIGQLSLSFTPAQWANILAAVASVSPKPIRSMAEKVTKQ